MIGKVTFIFTVLFTLIVLGVAGQPILNLWTVATPSWVSGVELFLLSNAQFFILFGLILGTIGFFVWGSS